MYGPVPDPDHAAANPIVLALGFVLFTGLLQPLLPCMILLLTCNGRIEGFLNPLARFLSARWLLNIESKSFDIYLLHPIVIMCVWSVHPPSQWLESPKAQSFLTILVFVFTSTWCAACLQSHVVTSLMSILQRLIRIFSHKLMTLKVDPCGLS